MNFFRIRREKFQVACDTIIKARGQADHHIAVIHGHVRLIETMHADHAQPLFARRRERA